MIEGNFTKERYLDEIYGKQGTIGMYPTEGIRRPAFMFIHHLVTPSEKPTELNWPHTQAVSPTRDKRARKSALLQ